MASSLSPSSKKTFAHSLREKGLRPTKQRACVYEVILDKRDHPTADDIFDRVKSTCQVLPLPRFITAWRLWLDVAWFARSTWTAPLPVTAQT